MALPAPSTPDLGVADQAPAPAVVLRGSLDELDLLEAIRLLSATAQTGVLRLSDPFPADVHLVGGRIGCVRLEGLPSLADALRRRGLFSPAASGIDVAAMVAASPDPHRCQWVVRDHLLESLFALSVLGRGAFDFVAHVPDPWAGAATVDVADALADHERRLADWRLVADHIPPAGATPSLSPRLPPGVEEIVLGWAEWRVLVVVDGTSSVAAVAALSGMAPLEACRALHQLIVKGLVAVA